MDRSSNAVKIEKIRRALETKKYDAALAIAKTVDSAKIKSAADLSVVAEAYDKNGIYDTALVYYEQIYLKNKTRRILIHLINLCLKLSMADMAELYLRDFSEMAPRDFYRYIFRYHIDKLRGEDLEVLIYDLEQLKAENFMEDWAYELAKLYHKSEQSEKCILECNEIILWFGNGMYVERARGLRTIHLSRLGRGGSSEETGIAKEVRRLIDEGRSMQELEDFIEEATIPEGNAHYSEEEYNQERFGKPVYDEEGKDVIWNTREFGAITEEMIQQQNTMDLLQGMQVSQQLRMQLGSGNEMEVERPEGGILEAEEPKTKAPQEWESFAPPKDDEAERARQMEKAAREREAEQELYRMLEQNESEEELSKAIRKLTVGQEAAADTTEDKHTTKRFHLWRKSAERKEAKTITGKETQEAGEATGETGQGMRSAVGNAEGTQQDTQGFGETAGETGQGMRSAVRNTEGTQQDTQGFGETTGETGQGTRSAVRNAEGTQQDTQGFGETAGETGQGMRSAVRDADEIGQEDAVETVTQTRKAVSKFETFRTGAKILTARVGISGFEPETGKAAGKEDRDEEPLPEIAEIDFGTGEVTGGNDEGEPEDEPEPLYEYPEEITTDYAKEAPTLDARLKNRGMKMEEFFGGFLVSADVRRQLFRCMEHILTGRGRAINIILTGEEKSGKTTLAKAIAKCTQMLGGIQSPRVALIRGDKLNRIDLEAKKEQLRGSTMLIEKASGMNEEKVAQLLDLNGELAGETAVILEDERSHMNVFLRKNEEMIRVYNNRIDLPEWTTADLFLQALSMLYRNEYAMTESVAGEFLNAVRDCIQENPEDGYNAVCEYTQGVLKRAEKRMAQMLREFALDGEYKEEELTMLREEDLYGSAD